MIVFVNHELAHQLRDAHDFRRFHVEIAAPRGSFGQLRERLTDLIEFEDDANAWVSADRLRTLPEVQNDAKWQDDLHRMIEKARPHGWIRDQPRLMIKSHVVWVEVARPGSGPEVPTA